MSSHFIHAGYLIDGSGGLIRKGVLLTIQEGRVMAVDSYDPDVSPSVGPVMDLSFATLAPPFVDCRVHLAHSGAIEPGLRLSRQEESPEATQFMIKRHLLYCCHHGILAVRDADDRGDQIFRYQGESGDVLQESPVQQSADSAWQAQDSRRALVLAQGKMAVRRALTTGCDAIVQGVDMGRENLLRMVEQQVVLIPMLHAMQAQAQGAATADERKRAARELDLQCEQVALAREWGVSVAIGTDSGSPGVLHGEAMVAEMRLLIKCGYSLAESVQCATANGARLLDLDAGRVKAGGPADFLVARGTPSQLPRKFTYLESIFLHGQPSPCYRKNPVRGASLVEPGGRPLE